MELEGERVQMTTVVKFSVDQKKQIEAKFAKLSWVRGAKENFSMHGSQIEKYENENWRVKIFVEVEKI